MNQSDAIKLLTSQIIPKYFPTSRYRLDPDALLMEKNNYPVPPRGIPTARCLSREGRDWVSILFPVSLPKLEDLSDKKSDLSQPGGKPKVDVVKPI